jgi:Uma2 family endonuclease
MAETDLHRNLMVQLIQTLETFYEAVSGVYVTGNLLMFYESGNKRRHLSPDVMVVKGVPQGERLNYLTWEEGKAPDLVIELTSSSTRHEDVSRKFRIYQDTLRVQEYFLFDPFGDYLDPPLQGNRLTRGKYVRIRPVRGRLPSKVMGLHLESRGKALRLYDPNRDAWLPTPEERLAQTQFNLAQTESSLAQAQANLTQAQTENARLQREVDELRRRLPNGR